MVKCSLFWGRVEEEMRITLTLQFLPADPSFTSQHPLRGSEFTNPLLLTNCSILLSLIPIKMASNRLFILLAILFSASSAMSGIFERSWTVLESDNVQSASQHDGIPANNSAGYSPSATYVLLCSLIDFGLLYLTHQS